MQRNASRNASGRSRNARARQTLRNVAWAVVALTLVVSTSQHPGPGGAKLGLILAGLLAWRLKATTPRRRKR